MVSPDELIPPGEGYHLKPREELIALLKHRDSQIDGWRVAWKWEQGERLKAQTELAEWKAKKSSG